MYDLDAAPLAQQSTSSDYKQLINQPNTNELDTDFSIIHPPTLDDILNNSAMANEAGLLLKNFLIFAEWFFFFVQEDSSSSDIFSNSVPSAAAANTNQLNLTEISSTENLSSLQIFNSRRQEEIAKKDVEEKQKIEELRQKAKDDIERWYQDRRMRMEQKRQTMKRDEDYLRLKALEKSDKDSCDWAKVIRLLEFSQGSQLSKSRRDLNRMKSSMINAKRHKDNQK